VAIKVIDYGPRDTNRQKGYVNVRFFGGEDNTSRR